MRVLLVFIFDQFQLPYQFRCFSFHETLYINHGNLRLREKLHERHHKTMGKFVLF